MAAGSNAFYSQQYASAVELAAQQMRPRIATSFSPMTGEGKAATVVNLIDAFEADERSALYDPIVFAAPTHTRPWVYPRFFDKAVPFDSIEQMQMNANPQSEYVMGVVAAINRKMDDEAIRAFFADRNLEGTAGVATDSFNTSTNQVGVNVGGSATGLNVEKLQNAFQIFEENEVLLEGDDAGVEEVYCDGVAFDPPAPDMTERFKAAEAHAAKLEAMGREKRTSGWETQAQRFIGRAEGIREALRMLREEKK